MIRSKVMGCGVKVRVKNEGRESGGGEWVDCKLRWSETGWGQQ